MAASFKFEFVSPERLLLSAQVNQVVLPASDGEITILANHAPTMTTIKPGVVTVSYADGRTDRFIVFGGFADILPSGCTLLAESAVPLADINRTTLDGKIEAARKELGAALGDENRTRIEQFISELTTLRQTVIPA